MPEYRSEITIKFNQLPPVEPAENKKVRVELLDTNGIKFSALINKKSWNKAERQVEEWENYAGAISGKLKLENNEFFIDGAGVKVFEKKPKEEPAEQPQPNASASASA